MFCKRNRNPGTTAFFLIRTNYLFTRALYPAPAVKQHRALAPCTSKRRRSVIQIIVFKSGTMPKPELEFFKTSTIERKVTDQQGLESEQYVYPLLSPCIGFSADRSKGYFPSSELDQRCFHKHLLSLIREISPETGDATKVIPHFH